MHAAQVVVGAVPSEVGDHLNAQLVPVGLQQLGVALDVEVANQRGRAGGVDDHALDFRHFVEGFVHALFQALFTAEHHMAFLHVGRPHVLHIEVAVIGRVALGMPGVVGTPQRTVNHLDGVFKHAADDQLGALIQYLKIYLDNTLLIVVFARVHLIPSNRAHQSGTQQNT